MGHGGQLDSACRVPYPGSAVVARGQNASVVFIPRRKPNRTGVTGEDVQVAHRGIVKQLPAGALSGHLAHGDFQLPACDFNNVFPEGDDTSALSDDNGNGIFDKKDTGFNNPRRDAGGITPACPVGTF